MLNLHLQQGVCYLHAKGICHRDLKVQEGSEDRIESAREGAQARYIGEKQSEGMRERRREKGCFERYKVRKLEVVRKIKRSGERRKKRENDDGT